MVDKVLGFDKENTFFELSEESSELIGGGVIPAVGVFLAAAALGYMMGKDMATNAKE